tara:strand:- start:1030 stop:2199 length:1170 start_codon:yes stop_codon:yes gene_type:complete
VTGLGDCYEANGMIFRDIKSPTARLIHADITPRIGAMAGRTYGHAWIEDGDKLVDHSTGSSIMDLIKGFDDMPEEFAGKVSSKSIFYGLADPKNIKSYDLKQMSKMITKHKHWGPWPEQNVESKMDFKLIDKEISEARLYRTTSGFNQLTGESVAELLYLNTLITFLMSKDDKQQDYAKSYAKQSTQYGKYTLFRSHATDLYLLAYLVSNPESKSVKLRNNISSTRHLKSLNFDKRTHWQFMFKVANGRASDTLASPYMFRLESQLKIKKSMYKQWRRLIMDWENLRFIQRQSITTRIVQELRRLGRGSELMIPMTAMLKYKKYRVADKPNKVDPMRRLAGTAAGAVAGRYAGKKIAKKLNKNVDKYKRAGTGIGAIAGYWASGRQKQK